MLNHFWSKLRDSSVKKTASAGLSLVCNAYLLAPILLARPGSRLNNLLRARPEILEVVHGPYLAANWDARTKIRRLLDHDNTVAEIGGILDAPPDMVVDLIDLKSIGPGYRITLDQARWLFREGPLVISLWDGIDRIFSLSFSLSVQEGERIAYVGGIQGRRQVDGEINILERYRLFTKAASGLRPRDFLVEVFKLFCKALGVTKILAVADKNHPTRNLQETLALSYDEIWLERGGAPDGNGFFVLPIGTNRRSEESIPAKKRAMYRKRFAMLLEIEAQIANRLNDENYAASAMLTSDDGGVLAKDPVTNFDDAIRAIAYAGAVLVLAVTKLFGGSWLGFAIGLLLVQVTYWLLRGNLSVTFASRIVTLQNIRSWLLPVRYVLAALMIGAVVLADVYFGGFRLGRAFNLYLIPLLLTSIFLGRGVALTVWLCCVSALYYLDVPPRFSIDFESLENVLELLVFTVLSGIVYAVPKLLEVSIELSRAKPRPLSVQ